MVRLRGGDLTAFDLAYELKVGQVAGEQQLEVVASALVGRANAQPQAGIVKLVAILRHPPEERTIPVRLSGRAAQRGQPLAGRVKSRAHNQVRPDRDTAILALNRGRPDGETPVEVAQLGESSVEQTRGKFGARVEHLAGPK